MRLPDPLENYPRAWQRFEEVADWVWRFPVFTSLAAVNRFQARYRFAAAFRGLVLDGYGMNTARGYDALVRLTLTWTAVEALRRAIGKKEREWNIDVEARYEGRALLPALRGSDPETKFFRFVCRELDTEWQRIEVQKFIDGQDANIVVLAKAIRHIFVHGWLTPNAQQASPESVIEVCNALAAFLRKVSDGEFERHVEAIDDNLEFVHSSENPASHEWPWRHPDIFHW